MMPHDVITNCSLLAERQTTCNIVIENLRFKYAHSLTFKLQCENEALGKISVADPGFPVVGRGPRGLLRWLMRRARPPLDPPVDIIFVS